MDEQPSQEGYLPFYTPLSEKPLQTYYKVIGDLKCGQIPLVMIHGGPGSGHEYLLAYAKLWKRTGIPIIFYDQIGCASSTRVPEQEGNDAFWQADRFLAELDGILNHFSLPDTGYDLLGHSWGGVLATFHAIRQPRGLRRLALAGTPANIKLFSEDARKSMAGLSLEDQQAVEEAVEKNDFETPAYLKATGNFYQMYWCRGKPFPPPEVAPALKWQAEDKTTRRSMMGPSPFAPRGPLAEMDPRPLLSQINVPTLLYNGEYDTAGERVVMPFFEGIPRVRWITFPNGSHMMHADSPELQDKVLRVVGDFFLGGRS